MSTTASKIWESRPLFLDTVYENIEWVGAGIYKKIQCFDSNIALNAIRLACALTAPLGLRAVSLLSLKSIKEKDLRSWVAERAIEINTFIFGSNPIGNPLGFFAFAMMPLILKNTAHWASLVYAQYKADFVASNKGNWGHFLLNAAYLLLHSNVIPCVYECASKLLDEASKWRNFLQLVTVVHYVGTATVKIFAWCGWRYHAVVLEPRELRRDSEEFYLQLGQGVQKLLEGSSQDSTQMLAELKIFLRDKVPQHPFAHIVRKTEDAVRGQLENLAEGQRKQDRELLALIFGHHKKLAKEVADLMTVQLGWIREFYSHGAFTVLEKSKATGDELKDALKQFGLSIQKALRIDEVREGVLQALEAEEAAADASPSARGHSAILDPITQQTGVITTRMNEQIATILAIQNYVNTAQAPFLGFNDEVKQCLKELQEAIYDKSLSFWDVPLALSSLLEAFYFLREIHSQVNGHIILWATANTAILILKLLQNLYQGIRRL